MKSRTPIAATAAVVLLVGLAACGDDKESASSDYGTDTSGSSGSSGAMPDHSAMTGQMISMKNQAFTPTDLTVAPGTQIMVMNADTARHDLEDKDSKGKKFNSGDLDAGKDGMITAPSQPGDYPYFCKYHFGMEGVLHVK